MFFRLLYFNSSSHEYERPEDPKGSGLIHLYAQNSSNYGITQKMYESTPQIDFFFLFGNLR